MCETISAALIGWMHDDSVEAVVIDHAEGRGFCAGGDVVMIARIATTPQRVQGPIGAFAGSPPDAKIEQNLPQITKLFASDRLEDVLAALEADDSDWALTELGTLRTKSPLSCKVSLRLMVEGANRTSFRDEMKAE